MNEETRKWIVQADKDLSTAVFASQSIDGPLPVTTGLHCQGSVEKLLKAYLHENQIAFSNNQYLNSLFESCIAADHSFENLRQDINQLAGYSIASRYPKADESLEFRTEALSIVKRVREFILNKLK